MKNSTNIHYFAIVAILALFLQAGWTYVAYGIGFNAGQGSNELPTKVAARLETADQIIADFGETNPTPATSDGVRMAFMPRYGYDLLGSFELNANTSYRVRMSLPNIDLKDTDNEINVDCFYPTKVDAGSRGKIILFATVNDRKDPYIGVIEFDAADDLSIINGFDDPHVYSGGGDLDFCRNGVEILFYTGATDEFNHPSQIGTHSGNHTRCTFFPY